MWMNTEAYIKRLIAALEQVVAPEIESDAVRGQLYAVVDLLNQLSGKIEYQPGIIAQDIEDARAILKAVIEAALAAGVETPPELAGLQKEIEDDKASFGLPLKFRMEEAVCAAIDLLHDNGEKLGPEAAAIDKKMREYLVKVTTRGLGLMKPPMLDRISRSKRPERK